MKTIIWGIGFCIHMAAAVAQHPVSWSYEAKKIGQGLFEIHCTAVMQDNWHIYAQSQPGDAVALPTSIRFRRNPLVKIEGKVKEIGRLEKYQNKELAIENWQYAKKVDFVQQVKLLHKGSANISGSIQYQACTNEKCLPPATTDFSILLDE